MKPNTTVLSKKERNYVAEITILNQMIEKENKNAILYDNYHINPQRLAFVTGKPNVDYSRYRDRRFESLDTSKLAELDKNLIKTLERHNDVPKNKQQYPATASQEIGWFNQFKQVYGFKDHTRINSKDTKFDEAYIVAKGHSQFSIKEKHN